MRQLWRPLILLWTVAALCACASVPRGRYGVDELSLVGVEQLDRYALRACLATQERERLSVDLSRAPEPTCGEPPFDARRIHLPLWRWPWTEWPLYDPSVFERDLARIERWYRARGFYGARVLDAASSPERALHGTTTHTDKISLRITLEEGQAVQIRAVSLRGVERLDPEVAASMLEILDALAPGARFDEAIYDQTKRRLTRALHDSGHAQGVVTGHVAVDPKALSADIALEVEPGPVMEVGDICIEGYGELPPKLILQASGLRPGAPFSASDIEDARTRIYQLRVLSEVEIVAGRVDPETGASQFERGPAQREGEWMAWQQDEQLPAPEQATARMCRLARGRSSRPRVPVEIRVKPAKLYRLGVGAGIQIGVEDGQRAINAAQQWDTHLFAYAEVRNFLGGLRRLRIEERPRVIFLAPFPRAKNHEGEREIRLGNNLSTLLEWPAFLENRTLLRFTGTWDRGPDPYGGGFIRDDFNFGLGPSRNFLRNRLLVEASFHINPYIPRTLYDSDVEGGRDILRAERYNLLFFRQVLEWDTRDDRNQPSRGSYARLELHETLPPSNWTYLRLVPELRHYVPLPYGLVLAVRGGIGLIAIFKSDARTAALRRLGPRPYRLRGGGPYSVRGVQAGLLGLRDEHAGVFPGGTRSWIASAELRVPLGSSFGLATFLDAGDIDAGSAGSEPRFRFDHPNTTLGAGVRYKTLVGPLRLDVGFLVPGLQGARDHAKQVDREDPLFGFQGAVLLTIGEAF